MPAERRPAVARSAKGGRPSDYVLLTRLFLRQFLENDLLSPDADRSQLLAVVGASVISLTLFISVFMSAPYSMSILGPGQAAILTLNDKFFYVSLAMLVTALVAASQWDALSVDLRDAAILDPLPVSSGTVRRAKVTAVAILGACAAIAMNVFPTFVFPWMLSFSLRQLTVWQLWPMMLTHLLVTVSAAVFGYLSVIAIRESIGALLGPARLARVSPWLQMLTIVLLGSAVLLLPTASTRVAQRGFSGWREHSPPMAFVGLYEVMSRGIPAGLPHRWMNPRVAERDRQSGVLYESRRPLFPELSRRAMMMLAAVAAIAAAATALGSLRSHALAAAAVQRRGRRWPVSARIVQALIARTPAARAGFYFTLAALWRNKAHRLTVAGALAVGLAMALVTLSRSNAEPGAGPSAGLLAIQPLLYGTLLVGFRHAVRVPAELRANWATQLAWRGHARSFAGGVQWAAILTLVLPAVLIVMPLVVVVAGWQAAWVHALLGVAGAVILLDVLMLNYDKVPFLCSYVPSENAKATVPLMVLAFLIGASLFARLELAIVSGTNVPIGLAILALTLISLRLLSATRRRTAEVDFNEGPATIYQLSLYS
jgi:hypothetical protein